MSTRTGGKIAPATTANKLKKVRGSIVVSFVFERELPLVPGPLPCVTVVFSCAWSLSPRAARSLGRSSFFKNNLFRHHLTAPIELFR